MSYLNTSVKRTILLYSLFNIHMYSLKGNREFKCKCDVITNNFSQDFNLMTARRISLNYLMLRF